MSRSLAVEQLDGVSLEHREGVILVVVDQDRQHFQAIVLGLGLSPPISKIALHTV